MKLLPVFGLFAPPLLFLAFFTENGSAFSGLGLSGDNMLLSVGVLSGVIWIWSAVYARSASKFLAKQDKGDFKKTFGVNSTTFVAQLTIWHLSGLISSGSVDEALKTLLAATLIMYVGGNLLRVLLTKVAFELEFGTAVNANKFNLVGESIAYALAFVSFKLIGAW
jgi:hypothetical protein